MTVAELIAALQEMPQEAEVEGLNRDMIELRHGRNMHAITLQFLEHAEPTARAACLRDMFVE